MQTRTACIAAIYDKTLRLKSTSNSNSGSMINLATNDVRQWRKLCVYVPCHSSCTISLFLIGWSFSSCIRLWSIHCLGATNALARPHDRLACNRVVLCSWHCLNDIWYCAVAAQPQQEVWWSSFENRKSIWRSSECYLTSNRRDSSC